MGLVWWAADIGNERRLTFTTLVSVSHYDVIGTAVREAGHWVQRWRMASLYSSVVKVTCMGEMFGGFIFVIQNVAYSKNS